MNFPVWGSKRTAPIGDDDQMKPLPSKSTVVAPPVGDMPCGGMNTSIFSVFGSSRPSPPFPGLTLNHRMPSGSRVSPCAPAASPFAALTLNGVNLPVLASILPTVTYLFGTLQVNQILPLESSQESCTP